jgi:ribosomal protein S27E
MIVNMKVVNKHTRAGKNGKHITCPDCCARFKVYHFAWWKLTCQGCGKLIWKYACLLDD